ncbi:CLUMA_CG006572, isoform A [Clunio marinus]|uniref:CLUMA_CG006572, isoform A n=1 Tax=Clunio marinus TaxID=568069 RepID=A0A1J1HYC0_9DIPT|nr:CLUMA_CG006572, isoform A [Clunio marinus]
MDYITHYKFRKTYERSVSEPKFEDYRSPEEFPRGHNLRNCYQDSSRFEMNCDLAKDLRVNKEVNGAGIVKEEVLPPRRYFCIFCKMDFLVADDFLDHLELHPNGSFVLVKRDLPQPTPVSSEPLESEEPSTNSPILPEMLQNQIKIEPISEDEDDYQDFKINEQPSISEASEANLNSSIEQIESNDPNHQLMVLSNPRIGDGPGEYLCNVCNAKFVYKNNLKSHLKRHLGIYPYICFCGKRYQFKCKLNKHIEQAHAKIKNFKCPVPSCPKKYFTRNDLAFHISVTHQERQEIPCHICNKVFNSQKSLQIHCRKYHRNQES